jgi:hypothetical protein
MRVEAALILAIDSNPQYRGMTVPAEQELRPKRLRQTVSQVRQVSPNC